MKLQERNSYEYGKLDNDSLSRKILGRVSNRSTFLGPKVGVDYGIYGLGKDRTIMTTDPLSCHEPLGMNFAARFGFHIILTDFLASGNLPEYMAVTLTLPVDFDDNMLDEYWSSFTYEAKNWSVDIVTGHTGRYPSSRLPLIGSATMCGQLKVNPPDIGVVKGGDNLYITGIPGIQAAVILSAYNKSDEASKEILGMREGIIGSNKIKKILEFQNKTDGILYLHDVTEGGLVTAMNEVSSLAKHDVIVNSNNLNGNEKVISYLKGFGINWLETTSEGCIIIAVKEEFSNEFESFMKDNGIDFSMAGRFLEEKGGKVFLDGNIWSTRRGDPYWGAIKK
ncbi:AIR synthase-related protein [Cuniculiplasma sp. SKW4]|uniref:AIR synthase-related protein n=1 Tax=Cuniculiplasma sp. SKW4 TaxID=3400171 RepID=UPI003FCF7464